MAVLTLAGASCTEPEFVLLDASVVRDGGRDPGRGLDGGGIDDGDDDDGDDAIPPTPVENIGRVGIPTWAQGVAGGYAMRARFFARGVNNVQEWHELIALVQVRVEGQPLRSVLTITDTCRRKIEQRSDAATVLRTATVTAPWRIEPVTYVLTISQQMGGPFATGAAQVTAGYAPNTCPSKPPQPWLVSRDCSCPRDLAALPSKPDDCRVNDIDNDGTAGLQLSVSERDTQVVDHVAMHETTSFSDGTIAFSDGTVGNARLQSASFAFNGEIATLDCAGSGRTCERQESHGCKASSNRVEFVANPPVEADGPLPCSTILELTDAAKLFDQKPLTFPVGGC